MVGWGGFVDEVGCLGGCVGRLGRVDSVGCGGGGGGVGWVDWGRWVARVDGLGWLVGWVLCVG